MGEEKGREEEEEGGVLGEEAAGEGGEGGKEEGVEGEKVGAEEDQMGWWVGWWRGGGRDQLGKGDSRDIRWSGRTEVRSVRQKGDGGW